MRKKQLGKKLFAMSLAAVMAFSFNVNALAEDAATIPARVGDEGCLTIPGTTSEFSKYNPSFLSVTGYASAGVHDRTEYIGKQEYRQVKTAKEFVEAVYDAQQGKVKVIEIMKDLELGYGKVTGLDSKGAGTVFKKGDQKNSSCVNPGISEVGGVSEVKISKTTGLTIFSRYGATLNHTQLSIENNSSDIVIRNIAMDGIWQWDNSGHHKETGFTFVKVHTSNDVWIDHCSFTIAPDGNIDLEGGASGITFSWCKFGIETEEALENENIVRSIEYMEELYQQDLAEIEAGRQTGFNYSNVNSDPAYTAGNGNMRYPTMRQAGWTPEEIMKYTAWHSKVHLSGAGDKDADTNPNIRLTLAYNWYRNIAQRVPMIRQGVGHLYNCYIDDMDHMKMEAELSKKYGVGGSYTMSRCMNPRNGASIAADTCEFYGINEPLVGAEVQGMDTANMNGAWPTHFKNAYNHGLIVNSKTTNTNGVSYSGSSWDNQDGKGEGINQFTKGFKWAENKPTYKNWAWSSKVTNFTVTPGNKDSVPESIVFEFEYDTEEKLPYEYQLVPLTDVKEVITSYSGMGIYDLTPEQWLSTSYAADAKIEPAGDNKVVIANGLDIITPEEGVYVGDTVKLIPETDPINVTDAKFEWSLVGSSAASKAQLDKETGEFTALETGTVNVRCVCTSVNGTTVSKSKQIEIKPASDKPIITETPAPGTQPPVSGSETPMPTDTPNTPKPTDTPSTPKPTEMPTPEPTEPVATREPQVVPGDTDGNGKVTLEDANAVLRAALSIIGADLEGSAFIAADVDKDGNISLNDAYLVLNLALGIDVDLSKETLTSMLGLRR